MARRKKGRNRNRSGGWSRRKDGRLDVYVTVETYDGSRYVTTTLPKSAADVDAEAWIAEVKEAARETLLAPPPGSKATAGGWVRAWLTEYRSTVRPVTYAANETSVRVHIEQTGIADIPLPELSVSDVRTWLAEIPSGAAIKNRALQNLRRALDHAVEEGQIAENPARKVRKLPYAPRETPHLHPREVWRYLEAVRGDPCEALFVVMATGGLRPSELLALRWTDFDGASVLVDESVSDLGGGVHDGRSPKTAAGLRRVPLVSEAANALTAHRARALERLVAAGRAAEPLGAKLIFPRPDDPVQTAYYSRHALYRRWAKRLKQAGLPHVPLYALRHTAAMLYAYAGADLKTTQGVLGQSDPRTLIKTYQHFVAERAREAAKGVDGILGPRESAENTSA
jgi:integrase